MHYDPNYRNQFFYDSSNSIGIREAISIARRELAVSEVKTKMPRSKHSKAALYAFLGVTALVLIASGIIWLVSKSLLLTIVLFVVMAFASVAVVAVVVVISDSLLRKNCCDPVEATCIGYSISGGSGDGSGGGLMKAPVFEYEYRGFKWKAFDGMYDNFSQLPVVSQKTKILVNPDDPEDIVWNFGKSRQIFLILAIAFGTVLSLSMLFVILNDDNFMNAALSNGEPVAEAQSGQNTGSEIASEEVYTIRKTDDGRIILDDAYLRNEVFMRYAGLDYVIKSRKITGMEILDDGKVYIATFEPDADFTDAEWFFTEEQITDEIKKLKAGDEYIYAEVTDVGASWVFSPREYELESE